VNPITLLWSGATILEGMLFLAAITRLQPPREDRPHDLLAEAHAALGHLGLTIIAVVFVILTFWKS
jgi:hypothetical protein